MVSFEFLNVLILRWDLDNNSPALVRMNITAGREEGRGAGGTL
jgi:hypothetical protein